MVTHALTTVAIQAPAALVGDAQTSDEQVVADVMSVQAVQEVAEAKWYPFTQAVQVEASVQVLH